MESFAKIVNGENLLTIFIEHSILDVWQNSKYVSVIYHSMFETLISLIQFQCKFMHFEIGTITIHLTQS